MRQRRRWRREGSVLPFRVNPFTSSIQLRRRISRLVYRSTHPETYPPSRRSLHPLASALHRRASAGPGRRRRAAADAPPRGFSPPGATPHVVEPLRFDRDGGERELGGCCDERSPRHAAQPASLGVSPPDSPTAIASPRPVQPISPLPVAFPRPARGGDSTRGLLGYRARPGTTDHRGEGPPARCQAAHPPVL